MSAVDNVYDLRQECEQNPLVSIVIVCMNNMKNLVPCLDSIRKYTHVSYETFVVAYLFSEENLESVKQHYPWVTIVESNEIRGFSENNNLALKQARGKYCFVLNDDTEMTMPVVDRLVESFAHCPENTAIVSPTLLNANGEVAVCGRGKSNWLINMIRQWDVNFHERPSKYVNQKGLFQTYNIIGAAFLVRTELFRKIGWFDERYFFCPEDVAVSTTFNKLGYTCYVNADVTLIHYGGQTTKSLPYLKTVTSAAAQMGVLIFYSEGKWYRRALLTLNLLLSTPCNYLYHYIKSCRSPKPNTNQVLAICDKNRLHALFMNKSPKETFIYFYKRLKK